MKKITMQEIADALNISRVTVWKALNGHPGVSETLRIRIIEKARDADYPITKTSKKMEAKSPATRPTVSIVVSRPNSSLFWIDIIHGVAEELSRAGVSLMYTDFPSFYTDDFVMPPILANGTVQGIIVLNVYDRRLIVMLNELTIPKVFLDVVAGFSEELLTGDLFLLDGKSAVYQITDRLIKKNLLPIGFVGDVAYAKTNQIRYEGFLMAMADNHMEVDPRLCLTGKLGIYTYYEEISAFLQNMKTIPRVFVCVSDYVAHFMMRCLSEKKYRIPSDVTLTGFDGSREYTNVSEFLTTVRIDTDALGIRLAKQLLYRIESHGAPIEVIHVYSQVSWRSSTDI